MGNEIIPLPKWLTFLIKWWPMGLEKNTADCYLSKTPTHIIPAELKPWFRRYKIILEITISFAGSKDGIINWGLAAYIYLDSSGLLCCREAERTHLRSAELFYSCLAWIYENFNLFKVFVLFEILPYRELQDLVTTCILVYHPGCAAYVKPLPKWVKSGLCNHPDFFSS